MRTTDVNPIHRSEALFQLHTSETPEGAQVELTWGLVDGPRKRRRSWMRWETPC